MIIAKKSMGNDVPKLSAYILFCLIFDVSKLVFYLIQFFISIFVDGICAYDFPILESVDSCTQDLHLTIWIYQEHIIATVVLKSNWSL